MKKSIFLLILSALLFVLPVKTFAGQCNYTVKQIQNKLPFRAQKMQIASQKSIGNMCSIILKVNTSRGVRFIPVFTVGKGEIIIGTLFKNRQNVTGMEIIKLQNKQLKKTFKTVKKELPSIVIATYKPKKANGKVLYAFVDPLCPFCHMMEKHFVQLADESGYTIKIVPFIVHGKPAENKVVSFICSKKTFKDYIQNKFGSAGTCKKAQTILSKAREIDIKLGLGGTPTFFTSDGDRIVGAKLNGLKKLLK